MKKFIIFLSVFLYADISNILIKINEIENYTPVFKKIYLKKCEIIRSKIKKSVINNKSELRLEAIFNNKALIDNKWVSAGDFVKGYKVIKIYPKKVILKKEKKFFILKFNNNNLLKVVK